MRMKKLIVSLLFMVIVGFCLNGNEAKAADTATVEKVMNVKCQVTAGTDENTTTAVNMRLVTSIDSLDYKEVGFKIYYNGAINPVIAKTSTVYERIVASAESGVDYNYNPKIVSTDSEYFVTCTLVDIARGNFDNTFYIKPYCITMDDETVYGVSRYVKVSDSYNDVINLPVKVTTEQADGMQVAIDDNNKAKLTQGAGYEHDGTYAHLTFTVNEGQALSSVTKFTIKDSAGSEITTAYHRNPLTTYTGEGTEDTTWYDVNPNAPKFVIMNAADLYGFAKIMEDEKDNFGNQTIYMGADIVVNDGVATTWSGTNAPTHMWESMGKKYYFGGTFDGQGDTISGLYTYTSEQYIGLFGRVNVNAKIQNLRLENSYFESTYSDTTNGYAAAGSIIGLADKVALDSIYSNAIIKVASHDAGGFVGRVNGASQTHNITNCWFDGSISSTAQRVGGIAGGIVQAGTNLQNCLFTGTISSTYNAAGVGIGGLVGTMMNGHTLTAIDCLSEGDIVANHIYNVGSIVGSGTFSANFTNVYSTNDVTPPSGKNISPHSKYGLCFGNGANVTLTKEEYQEVADEDITGNAALDLNLDYVDTWVAVVGSHPELRQFATANAIPSDTTWYDEASASKEYTITTMEELYGLAALSQSNTFSGWKFSLGKDITINSGESDKWDTMAPKYMWLTIGNSGCAFNGTFDGQGHTIKGVYLKTDKTHVGLFGRVDSSCQIKNLALKNSYIESTTTADTSSVGSVIGYATKAELESVYSDATVVCTGGFDVGGLVGRANGNVAHSMTNCWFDGTVHGYRRTAGLVGSVIQGTMDMTNCLNTGVVSSNYTGGGLQLGGFCGQLMNSAKITFTDCLNVSDIQVSYGVCVGSYVGWLDGANQQTTFSNTYSIEKFTTPSGVTVGKKVDGIGNNSIGTVEGTLNVLPEEYLKGYLGYQMTGFDFANTWVAKEEGMPELKAFSKGENLPITNDVFVADTSWYKASETNQMIVDEADLYGLTKLSLLKNTFSGKVIKLTDDMELNPGWKITDEAPANEWIPIGQLSGYDFAGSFDGNGHVISGVYVDSEVANTGLFGQAGGSDDSAYIKNFILRDSYFHNTAGQIGAVVGFGQVDISDIYIEDTVRVTSSGQATGGIVGLYGSTRVRTIFSCWFDGTVESTYPNARQNCGGIVGMVNMGTKTISNCLNTGTVIGNFTAGSGIICVGGIIGRVENTVSGSTTYPAVVTIDSCLNASDIDVNHQFGAGSVAGNLSSGTVTIKNTYTTNDIWNTTGNKLPDQQATGVGNGSSATFNTDGVTVVTEENLAGINGYYNTKLGFYIEGQEESETDVWVVREGKVPALKKFATAMKLTLPMALRTDTEWYNANSSTKTYTITTKEELAGLSELSQEKDFSGWTITLGADIVYNKDIKKPAYTWTPIRKSGEFKGIFGGADNAEKVYTISGLYVNTTTSNVGLFGNANGTLKNFRLTDSYFKTTYTGTAYTGSIAGFTSGTLHNIYSNATVISDGPESGGLVGRFGGTATSTISNCWFDGTVTGSQNYVGGIVGQVNMGVKTISNCLNTGTVTSTKTSNNFPHVGGFVGAVYYTKPNDSTAATTLNLENCLNTGKVNAVGTETVGALVGRYMNDGGTTYGTVNNVYYTPESYSLAVSTNSQGDIVGTSTNITSALFTARDEAYVTGKNAAAWTTLDFTNVWAVREGKAPAIKALMGREESQDVADIAADISWFENTDGTADNPYLIADAGDLHGLSILSMTRDFTGKTFKVTNDITVNSSVLDTVAQNKTPEILWIPIGQKLYFAGSFSGASSSDIVNISGLYYKDNKQYVGLFGGLGAGSTVQNISLKDSYFESTYNNLANSVYAGTIAGYAQTGLTNVYSNATIVGKAQDIGGLIGRVNNQSSSTESLGMTTRYFTNCWFDGNITTTAQYAGGLVGNMVQGGLNMTNCLFTGTLTSTFKDGDNGNSNQSRTGGLCGYVQNSNTKVDITDCISTGKIIDSNNGHGIGTIIGRCSGQNQGITLTDVYATAGGAFGSCESTVNGGTQLDGIVNEVQDDDRLIAYIDYLNGGGLDFGNTWTLRTTGVPALKIFVPADEVYTFADTRLSLAYFPIDLTLKEAVDAGVSNYVMTYSDSSVTNEKHLQYYNEYGQTLINNNGFTKVYDNTSDSEGLSAHGVYNSVFTKADGGMNWVVTVTHAGNSKKATYVSVNTGKTAAQALSGHMVKNNGITYTANDGYTTSGKAVTLRMNEVWFMGNSFVIQLPNGHFIINDGGADHEFKYLIDDLYKLTDGKKPIIEAWTITHLHFDHSDVLSGFYDYPEYADKVYVEAIYVNEPSHASIETDGDSATLYSIIKNQRKGIKLLRTTNNELPQIYRYQTGQRFYFEGVTMDVVQAQEQIPIADYSGEYTGYADGALPELHGKFNTTSTSLIFTIADGTTTGKKVYIGGDATQVNQTWMMNAYSSSLFADVNVFTALHHGANTTESFTKWSTNNYSHQFDVVLLPRMKDVTEVVFQKYCNSLIEACKNGIDGCYAYATGTKILTFNSSGISVTSESNKEWIYHEGEERPQQNQN